MQCGIDVSLLNRMLFLASLAAGLFTSHAVRLYADEGGGLTAHALSKAWIRYPARKARGGRCMETAGFALRLCGFIAPFCCVVSAVPALRAVDARVCCQPHGSAAQVVGQGLPHRREDSRAASPVECVAGRGWWCYVWEAVT